MTARTFRRGDGARSAARRVRLVYGALSVAWILVVSAWGAWSLLQAVL